MELEASALVGHNIVGDMKILDRVDFVNEFDLIGIIDTQIIVEDTDNECLPKGLADLVLLYHLYDKIYSRRKAKKDKCTPLDSKSLSIPPRTSSLAAIQEHHLRLTSLGHAYVSKEHTMPETMQ